MEAREVASSPSRVLEVLEEAKELLEQAYARHELGGLAYELPGLVRARKRRRVIAIGDVHGDFDTLQLILKRVEAALDEDAYIFFLGDYVDRGPHQVESFVAPLLLLLEHPGKVVVLRGNHEPPPGLEPIPHDYREHLLSRYGLRGHEVYRASYELFQVLPALAIVENELLLVHGGPPVEVLDAKSFEELIGVRGKSWRPPILEQLLWNDPDEYTETYTFSPRGAGYLWGYRVTVKALELAGVRMIVRGHEPAFEGFKVNHGGRVLTLFSRRGPPYMNPYAAYMDAVLEDEWYRDPEKLVVKV